MKLPISGTKGADSGAQAREAGKAMSHVTCYSVTVTVTVTVLCSAECVGGWDGWVAAVRWMDEVARDVVWFVNN